MVKKLQTIYALTLLISTSLLPMEKAADVDEFAQAKNFHEILQRAYHGLLQDGVVESYYKKINPITSTPKVGVDRWQVDYVSIAGEWIYPTIDGFFKHGDISFTIDHTVAFDPNQPLDVLIAYGEEYSNVQFIKSNEIKLPISYSFKGYNDILNTMRKNRLELVPIFTMKGILNIPGKDSCVILIEGMNQCHQPITLRGMEIICNKDEKTTRIFLDFVDNANKAAAEAENDNPIMWEYSISGDKNENRSCTFFDSPETRTKWVPDASNFYDLNRHMLIRSLPWCFSNSDNNHKSNDQVLNMNASLYQIPNEVWELIFLAQNKYANIESDMRTERKAAIRWCTMKIIVKTSLVCKRLNDVAQTLLPSYTKEIKGYIDALGGKYNATNMAFTESGIWWFKVTEICKAMKVNLNNAKLSGDTLLTQAIRRQRRRQVKQLLLEGADPRQCNQAGEMPIDLAYTNGFLDMARLIKDHGGDPDNKYGYRYSKFVPKQELLDLPNVPQRVNNIAVANNNPAPIPPQTFSFASCMGRSSAYLFLAGISVTAVAYWIYTKYQAVNEDTLKEDECLGADTENKDDCLNEVITCTVSQ
jgi:hypothetical protein